MGLLYCFLIFFFVVCIIFPLSVLSYIEASINTAAKTAVLHYCAKTMEDGL